MKSLREFHAVFLRSVHAPQKGVACRHVCRPLIAAVILGLTATAAAGDSAGGPGQEARSPAVSESGTSSRQALTASRLSSLLTPSGVQVVEGLQAQDTGGFQQVQVHWETPVQDNPAVDARRAAGTLTARQPTRGVGSLPRRRSLELAETEVLVIAVDGNSRMLWWHVMTDPRLLRAETVTASGELSGGVTYLPEVDFRIAYPDDPAIGELRFYHPEWTGTEFRLIPLAVLSVH